MATQCLVAAKLALCVSGFVCGTVTAASLAIVQGNLGGACMLYGSVGFDKATETIDVRESSAASLCYFVTAVSVIVAVSCFILGLCSCSVGEGMQRLTMAVCVIFLFFLLISGCILKIGRDSLCSSIMEAVCNITSCEEAQRAKWAGKIDGQQFYTKLHDAETAVWVNFFLWIIVGVLACCQACGGVAGDGAGSGDGGGALAVAGGGGGPGDGETSPLLSAVVYFMDNDGHS